MASAIVLLPGDTIDPEHIPTSQKRRIGRGIKQESNSNEFISTVAGELDVDFRKKAVTVSTPRARYLPRVGDSVIAQVRGTSFETYHLYINAYSPQALLAHLSFEGATKKSRPQLKSGDLVYAKVIFAQKNMETELSCVNPSTGKADGLGPLTDGMLFDVSPGFADGLMKKQYASILDDLGARISGGFEIVVGKNGKVWVDCADAGAKGILCIGRALAAMDDRALDEKEQKKLVSKITKDLNIA